MSWIKTIDYHAAEGKLKSIYERVKGPDNKVDNVLQLHSLRPHTLQGHMTLYKSVLHHTGNTLPKWYLEALGVYVSSLNQCSYCVDHHFEGLKRLLNDDKKAAVFLKKIKEGKNTAFFGFQFDSGMAYAKKITCDLHGMTRADFQTLLGHGFTHGEILEINQVTSYFNYVNRSVLGLGITTQGDTLGLSPSANEDPENWKHH